MTQFIVTAVAKLGYIGCVRAGHSKERFKLTSESKYSFYCPHCTSDIQHDEICHLKALVSDLVAELMKMKSNLASLTSPRGSSHSTGSKDQSQSVTTSISSSTNPALPLKVTPRLPWIASTQNTSRRSMTASSIQLSSALRNLLRVYTYMKTHLHLA